MTESPKFGNIRFGAHESATTNGND